jgi:hypothetical protein
MVVFLEWGDGTYVGTTRLGDVGLVAAVFTQAAAFCFDFPPAGLMAAVHLCSGFLTLDVLLVAVSLGSSGASVTGLGERLGFPGEVVLALTTRPLGQRVSTPRPCPSARQMLGPLIFRRGRVVCRVIFRSSWGNCLAKAAFASYKPCSSPCG